MLCSQCKSAKHSFPMPSRAVKPNQKRLPADAPSWGSTPGAASTSPAPSQPSNDSPLQEHRPHNLQLRRVGRAPTKRAPASDKQSRLPVLSRATLGVASVPSHTIYKRSPHPSRCVAGRGPQPCSVGGAPPKRARPDKKKASVLIPSRAWRSTFKTSTPH